MSRTLSTAKIQMLILSVIPVPLKKQQVRHVESILIVLLDISAIIRSVLHF